jgi:hypothetical protein
MAQGQDQMRWLCPQCRRRGDVVMRAPRTERQCPNGHRWADGAVPTGNKGYVPMGVRLDEAKVVMHEALSALRRAEIMVKDCASYLTAEQRSKLSVPYELHQIEQAKAALQRGLTMIGEKA